MLSNYGIQAQVKVSEIKIILPKEFGEKIDFQQQYRKKESRKYNSLWLASDDDYIKDVINFLDNCDKAIITVAAKKRQMYIKGDGIAFKARQYHYIKKAKFLYQVINMAKNWTKMIWTKIALV